MKRRWFLSALSVLLAAGTGGLAILGKASAFSKAPVGSKTSAAPETSLAPSSFCDLPPLPDCSGMWPLRLDLVLDVPASIWEDFCTLRQQWGGCVATNGFHRDCESFTRAALERGDWPTALHWRAVQQLAVWYAHFPSAAIEVEGRVFYEFSPPPEEDFPPVCDADLERVFIGGHPGGDACYLKVGAVAKSPAVFGRA